MNRKAARGSYCRGGSWEYGPDIGLRAWELRFKITQEARITRDTDL